MHLVRYKRSEYLMPWKWRKKNPLHRFIVDIPYALYFSVVPGREALNEVLRSGSAGGGMGTGLYWEPFEVNEIEYLEVCSAWREFDLRKVLKFRVEDIPDLSFVFDDEILAIPKHLDYLARSREKYETRFWKQKAEQGSGGNG
jgi:hypothetical protein